MILWGQDVTRWVELKAVNLDTCWSDTIPVMRGLRQEQWTQLLTLAQANPQPKFSAALVALELQRENECCCLVTLAGGPAFMRKELSVSLDALQKTKTPIIDQVAKLAAVWYPPKHMPRWPLMFPWWGIAPLHVTPRQFTKEELHGADW